MKKITYQHSTVVCQLSTINYVGIFLLLFILCGCSSDDNDNTSAYTFTNTKQPTWSVDLTSNDATPTWVAPDPTKFESSMFIMVKLQDELVPYSTDDDLMTVLINGECRAVPAVRNVNQAGDIYFVLKIRGNSNDRNVLFALSYYCAALRQMFTLEGQASFATEVTYGFDEDFVPSLLKGCSKYPVQNSLTVELPTTTPFVAHENDCIAVFVGNECRGKGTVGKPFTVFRKTVNETLQLCYYSTQKGGTYSMTQPISINEKEDNTITFKF